jgi:hypothetical protein
MTVSCGSVAVVAIGNISVSSTPTVARIWLSPHSGSYADTGIDTNNTISSLPIGDYDIKLVKSGYQDYIASLITVTSGGTATVSATLTLSTGSASFTSTPSGAEVFIDNTDQLTTTPSGTITGLTPGSNNHTYKLTLSGYADATGTFSISPGANTAIPVTFAGSAHITSTPTGAEVFLAPSPSTPIDQGYTTDRTFTGMTDASSGATTIWNYKLTKAGYTDNTGSLLATAGQTVEVPKTMLTVANIVASGITVIPSDPCIEGTCSVTVNVTWINNGQTAGLHDLSIAVGGGVSIISPPSYSSVAFDANGTEGDTVTRIFTVTGLTAAGSPHSICPIPNT